MLLAGRPSGVPQKKSVPISKPPPATIPVAHAVARAVAPAQTWRESVGPSSIPTAHTAPQHPTPAAHPLNRALMLAALTSSAPKNNAIFRGSDQPIFKTPQAQTTMDLADAGMGGVDIALHHLLYGNGMDPKTARAALIPIGPQGGFLYPAPGYDSLPRLGSHSFTPTEPAAKQPAAKTKSFLYQRPNPRGLGMPNGLRHERGWTPPFYVAPIRKKSIFE